jgi:hypothetical protein
MSESELNKSAPYRGGCQCGAVRYSATSLRRDSHVCHCRMCQKAVGNFFAALVSTPLSEFSWTRGTASVFQSSAAAERGFCNACGTPLFFRHTDGKHIYLTTGSFDEPRRIPLLKQYGNEGRLPQIDQLAGLPADSTTEEDDPELVAVVRASIRQHPDHETDNWPP